AAIKATGKWKIFPDGDFVGPGGHLPRPGLDVASEYYVQKGANRGCLLVRFGGGKILDFSEDDQTFDIRGPGRIYFCCNDERTFAGQRNTKPGDDDILIPMAVFGTGEGFADNTGALKVTITVEKAP